MKGGLQFGPFRLDTVERRLRHGDQIVSLTPKAFDLLLYLVEHPKEVLKRDRLLESLWPGTFVDDHALSVQIREIRKALGDDSHDPKYIETRHRYGYCFKADVAPIADAEPLPVPITVAGPAAAAAAVRTHLPETRYARSGDVNIAYQVIGHGPIDLVFVMGWVSHLEYFWTEPRFARFLEQLGSFCRVILFDKRGTGLSDRVPIEELPTIEQRMDDLRVVMNAAGSERAVVCGVSEGGCMSAVFAATYPEKTHALIMIGPYARRLWDPDYPWAPTCEEREQFIQEIRENWGGPIGLVERAPSVADDPQFQEWWSAYLRMGASPGAAVALTRMNSDVDIRPVLPLVRVPTLVIHRTGDRCLKVEEGRFIASRIAGSRFSELPGEDHLPFVGDQDSILNEIQHFISELEGALEADRVLATVVASSFEGPPPGSAAAQRFQNTVTSHLNLYRGTPIEFESHRLVAMFDGPARAVRCAWAVSREATGLGFQVRSGGHAGDCLRSNQAVAGPVIQVADLIRSRAAAGEVLVSGTLRDLVSNSAIVFKSHGRLELEPMGEWQILKVQRV